MLLCGGLVYEAAAQGFNQRHDLFGEGNGQFGWGIEVIPNGDALLFFNGDYTLDALYYSSGVSTVRVDVDGLFSTGFRLHVPDRANYPGWANCASPTQDGGYIVGGSTYAEADTHRVALYWFDGDGVVTNFRELDLPGLSWIGRQAKQTLDGGYVICGERSTSGTIDAFCVKTDAQGEVQWWRTYSGALRNYAMAVDLDGEGYFLGGQRKQSADNTDLMVHCLNDTGGVVWSKIWGTPFDEPNAHLITATDGNILVASAWGTEDGDVYKKYLAKLDRTDGTIMWDTTYGAPCQGCPFYAVAEVPSNGDLIAVGHTWDAGVYYGTLLRTTSEGDSLWMRNYLYTDATITNGRGMLRDVQPTADGGFIAAGVALSIPGQYTQDVWVIKTDSMGCIEPGCHLIQGMETQVTNLRDVIRVAPNPVASASSVQVNVQLPQGFASQGNLRLTVVSSDGRLVHEQRVLDASSSQRIEAPLSGGLYHIHLSDATRWISGAKLVVE